MTTQTRTGAYLKKMANGGHFKQKLGETALSLTECFLKADTPNRRDFGTRLGQEMYFVLTDVYGWAHVSAKETTDNFVFALQHADNKTP